MINKTVNIIHKLRIYFLVLIVISFFSYLGLNPVSIGKFLGGKIGSAVGMNVGVPENPFNKLALQLKEKEDRLNVKEQELNDRENSLNQSDDNDQALLIYLLGAGIIVLFILVSLNYYMDFRRKKKNG